MMPARANLMQVQSILNSGSVSGTANANVVAQAELAKVMRDALDRLDVTDLKTALHYALWQHSWNQHGPNGPAQLQPNSTAATKNYSHGRVMLIDFGVGNLGTEFSYPHPAIVLACYSNLLVVVPMTTDHGQVHDPTVEAGYIRVKKNDSRLQKTAGVRPARLMNDSIIMVPQMRVITKNRIKKDLFESLAHTPLMLEIEEAVVSQFCPALALKHRKNIEALQDQIQQLRDEITKKDAEIAWRDEQIRQYIAKSDPTPVSGEDPV